MRPADPPPAAPPTHAALLTLTLAEVLAFLRARGGQEYEVGLVSPAPAAPKRRAPQAHQTPAPLYRLTARGDAIEASGPAGRPRQLSPQAFLDVFGAYRFAAPRFTGRLTDVGPLFTSLSTPP